MSLAIIIDSKNNTIMKVYNSPIRLAKTNVYITYMSAGSAWIQTHDGKYNKNSAHIADVIHYNDTEWYCRDFDFYNAYYVCFNGGASCLVRSRKTGEMQITKDTCKQLPSRTTVVRQGRMMFYLYGKFLKLTHRLNNHITGSIFRATSKGYLCRRIAEKNVIHTFIINEDDTCQIDPEPYLIGYEIIDEYFVKIVKPQLTTTQLFDDLIITCSR